MKYFAFLEAFLFFVKQPAADNSDKYVLKQDYFYSSQTLAVTVAVTIVVTREPVKSNKSAAAVRAVRVLFHQIRLINERML